MAGSSDGSYTAPLPTSFWDYLRSFGPGVVIVLTWLGAGDIVEIGVAGGNFGYALMWGAVLAVVMRFLFVSLIAKYQLCNERGEGVLDGLARLNSFYPILLFAASIVMGHIYCAYMSVGIGEACVNLTGYGSKLLWAVFWNVVALLIVFRPVFARVETLFKIFLAVLSISFLGTAIWVGPNPVGIVEGTLAFKLPDKSGEFDPLLVVIGMIGAVGGSLMNLVYPYLLESKGWKGPAFRRVQMYDFLLAIVVMIILDLAIWTLGAELLYPHGLTIETMDDLPRLLSQILGTGGRALFYLGIFAAIYSSLIGHAFGLAQLGSHAYLRLQKGPTGEIGEYRQHPCYRYIVLWCLVTPVIWTLPNMPDFVTLTLIANSAQVVLIPLLAGGLWWITADARYIGKKYRNRPWENVVMLLLFLLAVGGGLGAIRSVGEAVRNLM
ncbi:MAG: hypothetical protein CMJ80_04635 [Planctomycetaceae bacterium]|nr:hypothetical protein [Planctomycetaceae bacterium]